MQLLNFFLSKRKKLQKIIQEILDPTLKQNNSITKIQNRRSSNETN